MARRGRVESEAIGCKQLGPAKHCERQQLGPRGIDHRALNAAHRPFDGVGVRHDFEYEPLEEEMRIESEPRAAT